MAIRTNKVTQRPDSRYIQGGTTDQYLNRSGWWERRIFPYRDSDIVVFIQPQEVKRPDRLAFRVYGRNNFQWIILQYNNIVDINTEFVLGRSLRIPTQQRLITDIMTRPIGGKRII